MTEPFFDEILETQGIKIPFVKDVVSERMAAVIRKGRYETSEIRLLRKILKPDDRVLELGAGVGAVSSAAAMIVGPKNVIAVEANPNLVPVILETHKLNEVSGISVMNGVAGCTPTGGQQTFFLRKDFWASSLAPLPSDDEATSEIQVPKVDINSFIDEQQPTVLVMDIEGGELDLLPHLNLSSCRHLVIELHPRVYGNDGTAQCFEALRRKGFAYDAKRSRGGTVVVFTRVRSNQFASTRTAIISCMKDEGPFILEWVAYHRSIGVTDFLIFTNDCSDGTVEILDRLDEMGLVRHLPNFTSVIESPRHQPYALAYSRYHKEIREADWIISMDVDEFINVHVGDKTLNALFKSAGDANVISMCQLDFGCHGIERFQDELVTEQFLSCVQKSPKNPSRRGIKTLIHKSAPEYHLGNHRPIFRAPDDTAIQWIDGSGRTFPKNRRLGKHNGMQAKGAYANVQLNHYPVRSLETYLTKAIKGNVVAVDSFVGLEYFSSRNGCDQIDDTIRPLLARTKTEFQRLLADPVLRERHDMAVEYHKTLIAKLRSRPQFRELLGSIQEQHRDCAAHTVNGHIA